MQNLTATQIKLLSTLNNGSMTVKEAVALGFDPFEIIDLDAFEFATLKGGVLTIAQKGLEVITRVKLLLAVNNNGSMTVKEAVALGFDPFVIIDLDAFEFATLKGGVLTIAQKGLEVIA